MSGLTGITPGDPQPAESYDPNETPQHLPDAPERLAWRDMLHAALGPRSSMDQPFPRALLALDEHVEAIRHVLWWLKHAHTKTDEDFVELVDTVFQTLQQQAADNASLSMRVEALEQRLATLQTHA